ncbi:hypothetical protein BG004_007029 [Podila humilis]|nr:hypothetical protein BG004_007029 [Podila humilis]
MASRIKTPQQAIPVLLILSSLHAIILLASAQSFVPETTYGSASGFIDGKVLFVQGGRTASNQTTDQSYSLDLSTTWEVATPPFKKLPPGLKSAFHPGTLLKDGTNFLLVGDKASYYYDVTSGTMTPQTSLNQLNGTDSRLQAAMDPKTGIVYVPNGHATLGLDSRSLLVWSPDSRTAASSGMPMSFPKTGYAAAWSSVKNNMLVFGGDFGRGTLSDSLNLFQPSSTSATDGSWFLQDDKGTLPSARTGACMVPMEGGSKMLLFGGESEQGESLRDLYVLEVSTWVWTRTPDAPDSGRVSPVCAVSNDKLVVVGGYSKSTIGGVLGPIAPVSKLVVVYDFSTKSWATSFNFTPAPNAGSGSGNGSGSGPGADSGSGSESGSSSGINVPMLIGQIVAALVLIVGIGCVARCWRRRLRSSAQHSPHYTESKPQAVAVPMPVQQFSPVKPVYQVQPSTSQYYPPPSYPQPLLYQQPQLQPEQQKQPQITTEKQTAPDTHQRVNNPQLKDEDALARHIQEQTERLLTMRKNKSNHDLADPHGPRSPQDVLSGGEQTGRFEESRDGEIGAAPPVPPRNHHAGATVGSAVPVPFPVPSRSSPAGEARHPQVLPPRTNPQCYEPIEGDEYHVDARGPRNPQQR